MFKWLKHKGGLIEVAKINKIKADTLYDFLDTSKLFSAWVQNPQDRSRNECCVFY